MSPRETLFIDDSLQHVSGARKAGLHAVHLTGNLTIFDTVKFISDINKYSEAEEKSKSSACTNCIIL